MASDDFEGTQENGNGKGLIEEEKLSGSLEGSSEDSQGEVGYNDGVMDLPLDTLRAFGGDELRARVFYEKYALRDQSGRIVEKTPEHMWKRVAREISSPEKTQKTQEGMGRQFLLASL